MQNFVALICLILLLPVFIIAAIVMLLSQGAPLLFLQERIGKDKIIFTVIKFRTMDNGQITSLGKILRRTGIDELPQLVNIIKGDMNFIGPRPLTSFDVNRLNWETSYYNVRWNVKPGLSGLGQLSPKCHKKMTFFLDKYYVINRSIALDLSIICTSFLTLFLGKAKVKKIYFKR